MQHETFSASEFKAKCLDIMDRVQAGEVECVTITKRGKTVAMLVPARTALDSEQIIGCMRGSVIIPDGVDLTAPVLDEVESWDAAQGILHQ